MLQKLLMYPMRLALVLTALADKITAIISDKVNYRGAQS